MRLFACVLLLIAAAGAQTPNSSLKDNPALRPPSDAQIAMINLSIPTYPPLARQANISGDVELKLEIRKDGSLQSAVAVSGNPMLTQAALDSARRSHFQCSGCEDAATWHSFFYSFQIAAGPGWPCPEESGLRITQSKTRVTIVTEPALVSPYFAYTPGRAAKCFYLWGCGHRWGGEGYYYYRLRSVRCLGLWSCGHRLREPFATCKKLHRKLSY